MALKRLGISVELRIARDGADAVALIGDKSFQPDLILLDIKLPKLSGIEVLRTVRSCPATQNVPIVMFTSSDDPDEMAQCNKAGANSFITKPVAGGKDNS